MDQDDRGAWTWSVARRLVDIKEERLTIREPVGDVFLNGNGPGVGRRCNR